MFSVLTAFIVLFYYFAIIIFIITFIGWIYRLLYRPRMFLKVGNWKLIGSRVLVQSSEGTIVYLPYKHLTICRRKPKTVWVGSWALKFADGDDSDRFILTVLSTEGRLDQTLPA